MKKLSLILYLIILNHLNVFGQSPYPLIPIDSIQFVSNSKLLENIPNDSSNYVNPYFKNLLFKDTVKFEGYVLFDPRLYGSSTNRKSTIILNSNFGNAWGGVELLCEPAGTGRTLTQLLSETKFYENLKVGTKVRVTGVMRTFKGGAPVNSRQGQSQVNVIRNTNWDNSIQIINPIPINFNATKITLSSLMLGNDSIGRIQNKVGGEKWEGVFVELNDIKVRNRTQTGSRWSWSVEDKSGNSIDVSDFSGWFRNDNNSADTLPIGRFTPPQIGTRIKSLKGVIMEAFISGQFRFTIAPLQPSDIDTTPIIQLNFNLPNDSISVINIDSVVINAGGNFYQYHWSNGQNSKIAIFHSSGWFYCTVFDSLENSATDSIFVNILNPKIITPKSTICLGDSIILKVDGIGTGNIKQGLVAFYPFNGNAKNIVDSLSNGTVYNAILTNDRFENPNSAYSFNGTNSNITSVSGFGIDTGSLTISCWAKPDLTASFDNTLLSLYNTNIYVDYGIRMFTDSSISGIRHRPCVVGDRVGIFNFVKNQWNFMAVSYNSITDTMTFYLNGKLIGKMKTLENGSTCNTTSSRLTIGADFSLGLITQYKGLIDDISIYNRELNNTEVKQIYTGQNITNNFIWSNGDTTESIKVSPSDSTKYWVKQYNNWNQCFDTIQISVDKPNNNFLSDSTVNCKLDSVILTAPEGYSSYLWNGFDSSRTIYAKPFNKYSCKITSANGCFASDSTFVNLLNPKIKSDKQIICFRDSITLTTEPPKPNVDSTLQYITTFQNSKYYSLNSYTTWTRARDIATALGGNLWIVNSTQENDSVYSKIKNNQQFYWIGLSRNSLGNWKWVDNTDISYSNWGAGEPNNSSYCGGAEPYAAINWGGITSYGSKWNDIPDSMSASCMINRTSRAIIEIPINRVLNNQFRIEWSTGDTTESIKVSPEYETAYWVKYFNNGNSCIDTVTIQVNKPNSGFHVNSNQQCFNTHKFEFYNNSNVNFGSIKFEWIFEDGFIDTSLNPIKYFIKDSTYKVKLRITSNYGCKDSLENTLTLYKNPNANFVANDFDQCIDNNQFLFTNLSTINNSDSLQSFWTFGGTDSTQVKNPSKSFNKDGKLNVKLVVLSSKYCRDSTEKFITVYAKPTISSIIGKEKVNPLSNESYSVSLSDSTIYRWKVLGGNIISGQNNNLVSVQWGNIATGYIGVIAADNKGCISDSTKLSISITTVGIDDVGLSETIRIYPNPTTGLISIDALKLINTVYEVTVMDVQGRILIKDNNMRSIDFTDYSDGTYYLQIESGGKKITKKIVKVN